MPRISSLTIQGFRSFGEDAQVFEFKAPLAVVWGSNSQGKTAVAEAIEFLLTGDIMRRKLLASALDEFADALCNAHLPRGTPTFVECRITDEDGTLHSLRRTVVSDFTKKNACVSSLELDGEPATDEALAAMGIVLSEPPLSAPVLMQHNLCYLFSAKPQERSIYFKSLLEVTDLDDVRDALKDLIDGLVAPSDPHLTQLDVCLGVRAIAESLAILQTGVPSTSAIRDAIASAASTVLAAAGETPAADQAERFAQLDRAVMERRARTFPLDGFKRDRETLEWSEVDNSVWTDVDAYAAVVSNVSSETQRLLTLFQQVLELPHVATATEPLDCPVCETRGALTPERISAIRERTAGANELQAAKTRAAVALRTLDASATNLTKAVRGVLPHFLTWDHSARVCMGFRASRLASLLDEEDRPLVRQWFCKAVSLARRYRELSGLVAKARDSVSRFEADVSNASALRSAFDKLPLAKQAVAEALVEYVNAERQILTPLRVSVCEQSDTIAWSELAELGRNASAFRAALVERVGHATLESDLDHALRDIDSAKEAVLEDKFNDLGSDVATWWELLRPGEPAFFSGLGLRKGGRRNIDFKASLAASAERTDGKIRDAVAVFSQSQLHCLGLATFLARTSEGIGFVVLDDPILTVDDDYSVHFINGVLAELLERGTQVILLTYEQRTRRAICERYDGDQSEEYQLTLDDPLKGTIVEKTSDTLSAQLKAAQPFTRSNRLATRKEGCVRIRDCAECFCKNLAAKKRREQGDTTALVSDYTGSKGGLDHLIPVVTPYLEAPDEPGKLSMLRVLINSGNHDDDVPSKTTLATFLGNLKTLHRKYL